MLLAIQIIGAILIFSILVFVHELGHFIMAKKFGVLVHEFAIGMGPVIWKKQKGETQYSIRCIPLGGFCKMEGEDEESEDPRSFTAITWWKKIIILAFGGLFNLLMGLILCVVLAFTSTGVTTARVSNPTNPALKQGDIILSIDGKKIFYQDDIDFMLSAPQDFQAEKQLNMEIKRGNEIKNVVVTAEHDTNYNRYFIGYEATGETSNFLGKLKYGFYQFYFWIKYILFSITWLITGKVSLNELSGPIGIVGLIGSAVGGVVNQTAYAWQSLANFFIMITINLGIFNLIPFPALDGGRIFFVLVSTISRKKISEEKEGMVHLIGFAVLILLIIFATKNDIVRMFFPG